MFAWLWHHLPGPRPVRAAQIAVLVAAFYALLWFGVFPLLDQVTAGTVPTLDID
ncbi:hypothetical protein AB0A74_01060 [Saccharothrix sp. NPDC042600]|uniref:hypothetical protein n=1 Tax=Saccharothrix TaxID=2071 RepID=UPI0033DB34B8|nr:hypothetical protein GCM10017745_49160 [Saccharothrix mutabilis subsp. capreolus]